MFFTTGNIAIDALVYSSWSPQPGTARTLSFSFLQTPPSDASAEDRDGFAPMNSTQRQAVRDTLKLWSDVANLTFVETAAGGALQFGTNQQSDSSGYAYLPEAWSTEVQMYLDKDAPYNLTYTPGSYGPSVMLHETGHMLGLKHPGNYDSSSGSADGPFLPAEQDNGDYTQMSYQTPTMHAQTGRYAVTPMVYDIQAIQYLYGANMAHRTGDDVYTFTGGMSPRCIWDAGGSDTFDFSNCTTRVTIDLRPGGFSETAPGYRNIGLAFGVAVERAITGNYGSQVYSGAAGSAIVGGAGTDHVYAGAGSDTVSGGAGNDTVVFAKTFASYSVQRLAGGVTVTGEGTDKLDGIETLIFSDRTVAVAELPLISTILGTSGSDSFQAGAGSEIFDGGAGRDTVLLAGARASYTVQQSNGALFVADNVGNGGTDQFIGVELLRFGDVDVSFEINGVAGQAYRLYQAAFDRVPDLSGLGYWIRALEGGVSLQTVANDFIRSPEFNATYGAVDNRQFATLLYQQALNREPDAEGLNWWVARLDEGAPRNVVLTGFSESAENQAQVIGAIQGGISFTPYLAG
ncbi:MAG: protease [Pseudoduganella sp.]|jgi:hypothetical protein|nr:protease [Pseudoduganella sp.]